MKIEFNITPLFYVEIYEQWTQFMEESEDDFYNFEFLLLEYENDKMLDRHDFTIGFLGFVICFKKNVLP